MIPYELDPLAFWFAGVFFVAFLIFLLATIYTSEKTLAIFSLTMLCLVAFFGGIVLSGDVKTVTINVCNKETIDGYAVLISTDQQAYIINDQIVDMKAPVGKQIVAHVASRWGYDHPHIYAIDGPVPCGNGTCAGV